MVFNKYVSPNKIRFNTNLVHSNIVLHIIIIIISR